MFSIALASFKQMLLSPSLNRRFKFLFLTLPGEETKAQRFTSFLRRMVFLFALQMMVRAIAGGSYGEKRER